MTGFLETHRYRDFALLDGGRRFRVSAAYVRAVEEAAVGCFITVADSASSRWVREDFNDVCKWLDEGTVRYSEVKHG